MLFESTSVFLRNIVQALESENETRWDDHTEAGSQCIYELHQMASSSSLRADPNLYPTSANPDSAVRAIPYMKRMNLAIRHKDRSAAVEAGKAALSELHHTNHKRPIDPVAAQGRDIEQHAVTETTTAIAQPKRKLTKSSVSVGKRNAPRVRVAGAR